MKIRKIGDILPTPNHRIAIGIHAIGEIGPQHLEQRIEGDVRAVHPAHPQAKRHGDDHREPESGANAEQRRTDVLPQGSVANQFHGAGHHLPRRGEHDACRRDDDGPPHTDDQRDDGNRWQHAFRRDHVIAFHKVTVRQLRRAHGDSGLRLDNDDHLATQMRCARKRITRSDLERQAETLPRHHDRRAEHLRHIIEIAQ